MKLVPLAVRLPLTEVAASDKFTRSPLAKVTFPASTSGDSTKTLAPAPTFKAAPDSTVIEPTSVEAAPTPSDSEPLITSRLVVESVVRLEMESALFMSR